MQLKSLATTLLVVVLLAGCTSSNEVFLPDRGIGGQMGGPGWEQWTPRAAAELPVDAQLVPATVFDSWRIDDEAFRKPVWDGLFHLLVAVSQSVDSPALDAVMTRLEPSVDDTRWELSYLSHSEGEAEGIVLRIVTDDGAGVWLEAVRPAGSDPSPVRWNLRVEPAAKEDPGLAVRFDRDDSGEWSGHYGESAAARPEIAFNGGATRTELLDNLRESLWEAVGQRDYLDPGFDWTDAAGEPLADGWPAALGQPVQDRQFDDFIVDTVFPPRGQDNPL